MTDTPHRRAHMESPVDLDGAALIGGHPLLWTSIAIATAALFLGLTNAITIDGWAAELPPGEAVARLDDATGRWRAATDAAGLGETRAAAHAAWRRAQAVRFGGQPE